MSPTGSAGADYDDDDDDLADDLQELDELMSRMCIGDDGQKAPTSIAAATTDLRPFTGGTSHSSSSTAVPGSRGSRGSRSSGAGPVEVGVRDPDSADDGLPEVIPEDAFGELRGAMRAHYELSKGSLPQGCRIESTPGVSTQFLFEVDVGEGPYTATTLAFWIKVFDDFPARESFSIRSSRRIFHPQVDPETRRVDLTEEDFADGQDGRFHAVLRALRGLARAPRDAPAANTEAAMLLQTDPDEFRRTVRLTLGGGNHRGVQYDRVLTVSKAGGRVVTPTTQKRTEKSEQVALGMMQLEVMKDQFKSQANTFLEKNSADLRDLEF